MRCRPCRLHRGIARIEKERTMKTLYASLLIATLAFPGSAFAGWGAIAFNSSTGGSAEAHGYASRAAAQSAALKACGGGCTIINWEQNTCIAVATNASRHWGEGHGYQTQSAAVSAALSACGSGCTWKEWACK
jgi:hypothetical protein